MKCIINDVYNNDAIISVLLRFVCIGKKEYFFWANESKVMLSN